MNIDTLAKLYRLVQGYRKNEQPSSESEMAAYVKALPTFDDELMNEVITHIALTSTSPFLPARPDFVAAAKKVLKRSYPDAVDQWQKVRVALRRNDEASLDELTMRVVERNFGFADLQRSENIFYYRKQFIDAYEQEVDKEIECQLRQKSSF